MTKDRKRMKKVRKKRVKSIKNQIGIYEEKIKTESRRKDTTKSYWWKEIDDKFTKQLEEDYEYLNKNEHRNKKNS